MMSCFLEKECRSSAVRHVGSPLDDVSALPLEEDPRGRHGKYINSMESATVRHIHLVKMRRSVTRGV